MFEGNDSTLSDGAADIPAGSVFGGTSLEGASMEDDEDLDEDGSHPEDPMDVAIDNDIPNDIPIASEDEEVYLLPLPMLLLIWYRSLQS